MNATDQPPPRDPNPCFTAVELLTQRAPTPRPAPPDRLDEQISQAGARIALHREESVIAMQQELQISIVKMSHAIKAEIVGVKDRVNDLATALERVEKKLKDREAAE